MISIARTLGAPETVPAGKPAASASSASYLVSSLPSTLDTMCITWLKRSMRNWSVTLTVAMRETRPTSLRPRSSSMRCSARSFSIGEQLALQRLVLLRGCATRPRAGQRPDGHRALPHPNQDLRARARDGEAPEVEKIEERRRIDSPQRPVERERRQVERRLETLRQYHLKHITGSNVLLGGVDHAFVFGRRRVGGGPHRERPGLGAGRRVRQRRVERVDDGGEPLARTHEGGIGRHRVVGPHRRDHRDGILDRVEDDDDGGPHQQSRPESRSGRDWACGSSSISRTMS